MLRISVKSLCLLLAFGLLAGLCVFAQGRRKRHRFRLVKRGGAYVRVLVRAYPRRKPRRKQVIKVAKTSSRPAPPAPKLTADDYFDQAEDAVQAGKYPAALQGYQEAVKLRPDFSEAWYRLGWVNNELEQYDAALTALRQALALTVKEPERAFTEVGYAQFKLKQDTEALASYHQALALHSDYAPAYFGIGDVHYEHTTRYPDAIDAYTVGLQKDPQNAAAYYRMGWCYNELGRFTEALPSLRSAVRLDPGFMAAQIDLGYALYRSKQNTEALKVFRQAVALEPRNGLAYFYLGLNYLAMDKDEEALEVYRKLKELDPKQAQRLYERIKEVE